METAYHRKTTMRYVQLRAFHNVAVHGGFSRAAEVLSLTQPAISDQVRKLEVEYDIRLFDRSRKQAKLTDFGNRLLQVTNRLFEVEQQARELLLETRALKSGTLRIIADSPRHLLHILAPFRKNYPGIHISLKTGNSDEVLKELVGYKADIGVLGELPSNNSLDNVKLSSTPIIAFAAKGFVRKKQKPHSLAEIAQFPLVLREQGSKTRHILERFAASKGVRLQATIEAEGRDAVREIVASGAGIGFVSVAEFGHDDRLEAIMLNGEGLQMDEALVALKERSNGKMISAFMTMARGNRQAGTKYPLET